MEAEFLSGGKSNKVLLGLNGKVFGFSYLGVVEFKDSEFLEGGKGFFWDVNAFDFCVVGVFYFGSKVFAELKLEKLKGVFEIVSLYLTELQTFDFFFGR